MKSKICYLCRYWDIDKGGWKYHRAAKTDWRPSPGEEPSLRQFRCKFCKGITYHLLTEAEKEEEKYGKRISCC